MFQLFAKKCSENNLLHIGATNALSMMFMSMCMGAAIGTGVVVSQYFGAKDEKGTAASIANGSYACVLITIMMTLLALVTTVLSEAIAAVLCIIYAFKKVPQFGQAFIYRKPDRALFKKTMQVGIPTGFQYALIYGVVEVVARVAFAVGLTAIPLIGMWGIWLTTGLTWKVTAVFALFRYKHGAWKEKKLV